MFFRDNSWVLSDVGAALWTLETRIFILRSDQDIKNPQQLLR